MPGEQNSIKHLCICLEAAYGGLRFHRTPWFEIAKNVGASLLPQLDLQRGLRPVALLEFLLAAARARIVATNLLQRIAHRLLVSVAAVRAVDMAVVVIMVSVIVIVVAVRTMDMGLLSH